MADLKKSNFLSGSAKSEPISFNREFFNQDPFKEEYFSRQSLVSNFGKDGQEKLQEAKVVIVGMGGLGSPLSRSLAGAGLGTICCIDSDRVEISNLHRQHLYGPENQGQLKSEAALKVLQSQFPLTKFQAHSQRLTIENIDHLLSDFDVIFDCTDNFDTKYLIHDYAFMRRKNLVQASVYQYEGTLHSFSYEAVHDDGCYRCLWPETPDAHCVGHCGEVGVLSPLVSLLGSMQAQEGINVLLSRPGLKSRQGLFLDSSTWTLNKIQWPKDPNCPLCSVQDLDYKTWYEKQLNLRINLTAIPEDIAEYQVWDIREEQEVRDGDRKLFPQVKLLSLSVIEDYGRLIDEDSQVLILCESSKRSTALVAKLRKAGFRNIWSLEGGYSRYRHTLEA